MSRGEQETRGRDALPRTSRTSTSQANLKKKNGAHQQRTGTDSRGTLWGEVLATGRLLETLT